MKYRLGVGFTGVEEETAEPSIEFITGLSITFSGDLGILGVDVPVVLTAV
jgi:hypothetical protein